jgi:hypothetical protein
MPADLDTVFGRKMKPRPHGDFHGYLNVSLGKVRPIMHVFTGQLEKDSYALKSYLFCIAVHVPKPFIFLVNGCFSHFHALLLAATFHNKEY